MPYIAKFLEAVGLGIMAVGFLSQFPKLIDMRTCLLGIVIFGFGWVVENFILPRR